MTRNQKLLTRSAITVQILILLLTAMVAPVAAEDSRGTPDLPINLEGEFYVNGEKAPTGTIISARVNGEDAGSTVVTTEGVYGDSFGNKLAISLESEDYDNVEFYVNGEEVKVDPIDPEDIDPDGFVTKNIAVDVSGNDAEPTTSGSSRSGHSGTDTKLEIRSASQEESSSQKESNSQEESISREESFISEIDSKVPLEIKETITSSATDAKEIIESEIETSNNGLIAAFGVGILLGMLIVRLKKN